MPGICSYAGYLPTYRIERSQIFQAMGWLQPANLPHTAGEKTVAGPDEDSLTMAAAAADRCTTGLDRDGIGVLYFASVTAPFQERLCSALVAGALGLDDSLRATDFGGSTKAGTSALLAALDYAAAEKERVALVCAADCRLARAGSLQELLFGDGAAALAVGSNNVIASYRGHVSISCDFPDHLRGSKSRFGRLWEERWVRELGCEELVPRIVEAARTKFNLTQPDLLQVIYPCRYRASRKKISARLHLPAHQEAESFDNLTGDTGSAHPLLMLSAVFEKARPGELILVIGYGYGCDALLFEVTPEIEAFQERNRVSDLLKKRRPLENYLQYLAWRDMIPLDKGLRGEEDRMIRHSLVWRNRRALTALEGSACLECATRQFPPQRICVNPACGALDRMEPVVLARLGGKIVSFSSDLLAASINPPTLYGTIDINGGGRLMMEFTDCSIDDLKIGASVDFTYRIHTRDTKRDETHYFWKAVPSEGVKNRG